MYRNTAKYSKLRKNFFKLQDMIQEDLRGARGAAGGWYYNIGLEESEETGTTPERQLELYVDVWHYISGLAEQDNTFTENRLIHIDLEVVGMVAKEEISSLHRRVGSYAWRNAVIEFMWHSRNTALYENDINKHMSAADILAMPGIFTAVTKTPLNRYLNECVQSGEFVCGTNTHDKRMNWYAPSVRNLCAHWTEKLSYALIRIVTTSQLSDSLHKGMKAYWVEHINMPEEIFDWAYNQVWVDSSHARLKQQRLKKSAKSRLKVVDA